MAYGCPIAVAGKWFPDRRGFAVGLTLAGFGASALVVAPIMSSLISSQGPLRTFTIMGAVFLAVIVLASLPLRFPLGSGRPSRPRGRPGRPVLTSIGGRWSGPPRSGPCGERTQLDAWRG